MSNVRLGKSEREKFCRGALRTFEMRLLGATRGQLPGTVPALAVSITAIGLELMLLIASACLTLAEILVL